MIFPSVCFIWMKMLAHHWFCERNAVQSDPKTFRAHLCAGRDQSGRLLDRSTPLPPVVDPGREIGPRVERAGAHISPYRERSALRRHLLFALVDRTARAP